METARESESIDAVVVRCDSPGGFAPAADAMRRAIELTAEVKPVILSMGSTCASGGYWLATAADTIMAHPATLTGSIGVFSVFFDASGAFNKIGITYDNVQTSPYADAFSALRPLSSAETRQLEAQNENTYERFLALVAEARGMTRDQADAVAQGRVWTGADALDVDLVDVLGDLQDAVALAADAAGLEADAYRIRTLPVPKTFIEELTESMNAQAALWWTSLKPGQPLSQQIRALSGLEEMHGTTQALMPMRLRVQ
jgi:protease-4